MPGAPEPPVQWFAEGIIDRRKLDEYLLSPTHPEGRHKLKLWQGVFGIDKGDGELLERLIREGITQAGVSVEERPSKTVREPQRIIRQWQIVIPRFLGPNGNTGVVKTGWAFDPSAVESRPHLTNAYPDV